VVSRGRRATARRRPGLLAPLVLLAALVGACASPEKPSWSATSDHVFLATTDGPLPARWTAPPPPAKWYANRPDRIMAVVLAAWYIVTLLS
jgi:hypothetical protein